MCSWRHWVGSPQARRAGFVATMCGAVGAAAPTTFGSSPAPGPLAALALGIAGAGLLSWIWAVAYAIGVAGGSDAASPRVVAFAAGRSQLMLRRGELSTLLATATVILVGGAAGGLVAGMSGWLSGAGEVSHRISLAPVLLGLVSLVAATTLGWLLGLAIGSRSAALVVYAAAWGLTFVGAAATYFVPDLRWSTALAPGATALVLVRDHVLAPQFTSAVPASLAYGSTAAWIVALISFAGASLRSSVR